MTRREAERQGRRAESLAALWLRLIGWRILARRVRTPAGEVDLIARRGRMVAFVMAFLLCRARRGLCAATGLDPVHMLAQTIGEPSMSAWL